MQWKTMTWKPALPDQKNPSIPTKSLNSEGSCNWAGRWCRNALDSTQASHTNSRAASITWSRAPWAWRWAANFSGSGCPKFLWSFTKSFFSFSLNNLNFGPCRAIGGGAQPSQTWFEVRSVTALGKCSSCRTRIAEAGSASSGCRSALGAGASGASIDTASEIFLDPKIVIVNRLGRQLRIRLARVMLCQSSGPRSWIWLSCLCQHMVCRMGQSCEAGARTGTWYLSVPRHTNILSTCMLGSSSWAFWKASESAEQRVFPTRGAMDWASCITANHGCWLSWDFSDSFEFDSRNISGLLSGSTRGNLTSGTLGSKSMGCSSFLRLARLKENRALFAGGSSESISLTWASCGKHTEWFSWQRYLATVLANPWQ